MTLETEKYRVQPVRYLIDTCEDQCASAADTLSSAKAWVERHSRGLATVIWKRTIVSLDKNHYLVAAVWQDDKWVFDIEKDAVVSVFSDCCVLCGATPTEKSPLRPGSCVV
jgi:hypothetical protein